MTRPRRSRAALTKPPQPSCQEMGQRSTSFGVVEYIRIYTDNYRQLSWPEVWEAFASRYPDRWAVQMFPPRSELIDEQNIYHLFILPETPIGVNIKH